jgi:quinohemoprotein ethanol dehydrogenase
VEPEDPQPGGENLFLCSIVAVDAKTGAYKWHYQVSSGETWDYNAAMDMELADLMIDGKLRRVVI